MEAPEMEEETEATAMEMEMEATEETMTTTMEEIRQTLREDGVWK